jgi:hypothetical protein
MGDSMKPITSTWFRNKEDYIVEFPDGHVTHGEGIWPNLEDWKADHLPKQNLKVVE